MIHLPDEIILQIVAYLEPEEVVQLQHVSRRLLDLSRDKNIWKQLCFDHSATERRRRRLQSPPDIDPHLAELIRAANNVSDAFPSQAYALNAPNSDITSHQSAAKRRAALLANWDPTYVGEKVNFYEEFIQRHAPYSIRWFQDATYGHVDDGLRHEATGAGILYGDDGVADKLVAPLEDGSISIWDARSSSERECKMAARTSIGLLTDKGSDLDHNTRLTQSQTMMTETGAVECVSIDSRHKKAFFAVQNVINEVDLHTLQVVSRTPYPFPITALSESLHPTPLTVGTNWTLHLHDTRKPPIAQAEARCELIGGSAPNFSSRLEGGDLGGHVSLTQPGPLSILHLPTTRDWDGNGDIWVAGRFTSFLNFDRRFFPRLRGTVHSGARLSCLTTLPHPFIPHSLRQQRPSASTAAAIHEAKSVPGYTLIAAGEYKGKGSLELYGLRGEQPAQSSTPPSSTHGTARTNERTCYQNRQTASSSKLLSVAPHGTRLVFSDGDGNLKWVERDASTPVRHFNINDPLHTSNNANTNSNGSSSLPDASPSPSSSSHTALFDTPHSSGDIVQKIMPTLSPSLHHSSSSSSASVPPPLGHDNLVIWTGDGRLGVVGFGRADDVFEDAVERLDSGDGAGGEVRSADADGGTERERERERRYGVEMRRALERQAREARWLRGYGL